MADADRHPDRRLSRIPFSFQAEQSIRALAGWMQTAAIIGFIAVPLKIASAFWPRQDFGKLIDATLTLLIAVWVFQAGAAFRKVAASDTADQQHLMDGFTLLRRVYLLQSILILVVLAFLVIALGVIAAIAATQGLR